EDFHVPTVENHRDWPATHPESQACSPSRFLIQRYLVVNRRGDDAPRIRGLRRCRTALSLGNGDGQGERSVCSGGCRVSRQAASKSHEQTGRTVVVDDLTSESECA